MKAFDAAADRHRRLGLAGAIYTYLLVVYGGVVRITGSGMGCGDDWPNCNDALVPTFDVQTFIEYTHRLLAAGLSILTLWVLIEAVRHRKEPGIAGAGGLLRPAGLATALIVVQVLLGAVTVKLELPAGVTAVHFLTAMTLLATFLTLAVRAATPRPSRSVRSSRSARYATPAERAGDAPFALAMAALGLVVVAFGALTANVGMEGPFPPSGAALACQGFPLCNGRAWPEGGAWVHIHWTHRLLAFALLFGTLWGAWRARSVAHGGVRRAARAAAAAVLLQVVIAAGLVLMGLPDFMQTAHLAVGAVVWGALVVWALLARRVTRPAEAPSEPVIA